MLEKVRDKMQAGAEGLDPMSIIKTLAPQSMQSVEALQKAFWDSVLSGKKATVSENLEPEEEAKPKAPASKS